MFKLNIAFTMLKIKKSPTWYYMFYIYYNTKAIVFKRLLYFTPTFTKVCK